MLVGLRNQSLSTFTTDFFTNHALSAMYQTQMSTTASLKALDVLALDVVKAGGGGGGLGTP